MSSGATRRLYCGILFWLKVMLAITVVLTIFTYNSYLIYTKFQAAQKPKLIIDASNVACSAGKNNLARLEPEDGKFLYGFHVNWQIDSPSAIYSRTGQKNVIYNAFYILDTTQSPAFPKDMMNWHASLVGAFGGILEVSLDSVVPYDGISDSVWQDLANFLKSLNGKYNLPIFLRLGHEMNGNWLYYGMRPVAYKAGFRKCAQFVKAATNVTAMVWGPNIGINYPFGVQTDTLSQYPTAATEPAEFAALDTNGDGVLNSQDDPYGPYYPGDDVVDWVALSLYHYPTLSEGNSNPAADEFFESLTGTGSIQGQNPGANWQYRNFYDRFATQKNKPFMIPESGSPWLSHNPAGPIPVQAGSTELSTKRQWWQQILTPSIMTRLPKFKAYVNFEELKTENGYWQDFAITNTSSVLNAFKSDYSSALSSGLHIVNTDEISYKCDGSLSFN